MPIANWFGPGNQFCNRLSSLHFLRQNLINTKLPFIYFMGDRRPWNEYGPANKAEWDGDIEQMKARVGWVKENNPLWPSLRPSSPGHPSFPS
jgi:hypothetical protein